MTISTTETRISYSGNGITTAFSFPYKFLANEDLTIALVDDITDVETAWVLDTDYTVTGAGDAGGGTVTATTPPASNTTLVISRVLAITQETDYITGDAFPAETHETALDRLTMIAQQHDTDINRAVKLPFGSEGIDTELPPPDANYVIGWDSAGTALANHPSVANSIGAAYNQQRFVATAGQTVFTITNFTYALGIGNLAVYVNGVRYDQTLYTETDTSTVTFSQGLIAGDIVEFVSADIVTTTITSASAVQMNTQGGITTNVQAYLQTGAINVLDYIPTSLHASIKDGTNTTDLSGYIQSAIDEGDKVFFPSGTYAVSQIVITGSGGVAISGKSLVGEGTRTIIKGITAGTSIIRFGTSTSGSEADQGKRADHCSLENLLITASATYTYGIELQWLTNSHFTNVSISHNSKITTGMFIDFSWDNDFYHCEISAQNGIASGVYSPNRNTYHGLRLAGGGLSGIGFDIAGTQNTLYGCDISAYSSGIKNTNGGYGITVSGGYFESNTIDIDLSGSSTSGIAIIGNTFLQGVGTDYGIKTGANNYRGCSITGNVFRNKSVGIELTATTQSFSISGNEFDTCATELTVAGDDHFIGTLTGTFTPTANSLTVVGTPTYAGTYVKVGKLIHYTISITVSGGTTASTAGTTHFTSLPYTASSAGSLSAVSGGITDFGNGLVFHSGITRAYTPTWGATASQVIITGVYETSL